MTDKEKAERGRVINQKKNNDRLMRGKKLNEEKGKKKKQKIYI